MDHLNPNEGLGDDLVRRELPIDSPLRRRLPPLLRQCWYGLNQAFRRRIAHLGLTPDQFTALRSLLEGDQAGMTQKELTGRMSSDPNTIASLLERMENMGWITRRPHERDRRAHRIILNPVAKGLYEEARRVAVKLQADVLEGIPGQRKEQFLEDLSRLADSCREAAVQAAKPNP